MIERRVQWQWRATRTHGSDTDTDLKPTPGPEPPRQRLALAGCLSPLQLKRLHLSAASSSPRSGHKAASMETTTRLTPDSSSPPLFLLRPRRMFSSSSNSDFSVEVGSEERLLQSRAERTTTAENPGALRVFVVVHAAIVVSRRLQFPVRLCPDSQHQADVPGGAGPCHRLSVTPKSILPPPTSARLCRDVHSCRCSLRRAANVIWISETIGVPLRSSAND